MAKRILKISLYSAVIIVAGAPVGAAAAFAATPSCAGAKSLLSALPKGRWLHQCDAGEAGLVHHLGLALGGRPGASAR